MVGKQLSHYRILSEISRGGMGVVYRALDLRLDREVALKVLPPELVADPERKRRFVQEAKAAARLEHPHIGVVHEIDEVDGVTFIVMELISGKQLRDSLAKGPLPLRRALEIATDVAKGLAKAHEEGIIHRDLKPANIMVTRDGHTKIIDFGLAKLIEPLAGEGSNLETLTRGGETDPGKIMGTVSYMSPEQARGTPVDPRSDIFSFGIVIHELIAGQTPFQGDSAVETLNAILKEPAPRLPASGSDVTQELAFELQHIVDKCLAKEPADRFQSAEELLVDLRSARRRLESEPSMAPMKLARTNLWIYATAAVAALLLVIGAVWMFWSQTSYQGVPSTAQQSKPSIAVLYFENASGDPDLDWLRDGLTDMLVTDLSQSPNLDVLGMEELYQMLKDMGRLEEPIVSLNSLQEFAHRANTHTVIVGSFMRAGENIRINIRVQDAASGEILSTEKVDGVGEASLFSMVDELTRRIKTRFDISQAADTDQDLVDVTTESAEAYRYWVQAQRVDAEGKPDLTIPLLEKAVELDPEFASAWTLLASMHYNLGHHKEFEQYAKKAFDLRHHLPARERLVIEANYYTQREETYARGISAYEEAVRLFPDDVMPRNDLAWAFIRMERLNEANEHLEVLIRHEVPDPQPYDNYHRSQARLGQFEKGHEAIRGYLQRSPKNASGHRTLGRHLAWWGKLDEALDAFETAESLGGHPSLLDLDRWPVFVLREQWAEAEAATQRILASPDPLLKLWGSVTLAHLYFLHGQTEVGLKHLEQAMNDVEDPNLTKTHIYAAQMLLEKGVSAQALEQARVARHEGRGDLPEWQGLFFAALAHARLGEWAEADETAEELRRRTDSLPTEKEERRYHHLRGELALLRGDYQGALSELELAQSMLSARGCARNYRPMIPQHVPIWYALASASLASGDEAGASRWFQRIIESTTERLDWPIPYVRSFYFLGKIHEGRSEMNEAREYYRRFYDYWKDGDIDRERVEAALGKIKR